MQGRDASTFPVDGSIIFLYHSSSNINKKKFFSVGKIFSIKFEFHSSVDI